MSYLPETPGVVFNLLASPRPSSFLGMEALTSELVSPAGSRRQVSRCPGVQVPSLTFSHSRNPEQPLGKVLSYEIRKRSSCDPVLAFLASSKVIIRTAALEPRP